MGIFLQRVGPDADWHGMTSRLDLNSLIASIPYIFIGHIQSFLGGGTEVALLKTFYELGIINTIILFLILLYPLIIFYKLKNKKITTLPYQAAIFFGFLSLLHYGSLFRITSVFLFYVFYALFLKTYRDNQVL